MLKRRVFRAVALLIGAAAFSVASWAAGGEVSGYVGGSTSDAGDLTQAGLSGGFTGFYGGTVGARLGSKTVVMGDFGFGSVGSESVSGVTITQRFVDFGLGVDYGFGSSDKVVPFVSGALGIGHGSISGSASGAHVSLGDGNQLYAGVGGGARIYLGKSWGLKPEVSYRRYRSDAINTVIFGVGVFVEFGK